MIETLKNMPMIERVDYVARERFAWPGGYALGLLMKDCEPVCSACVRDEIELIKAALADDSADDWHPVAAYYCDADDDIEPTRCANCSRPISDATTPTPGDES